MTPPLPHNLALVPPGPATAPATAGRVAHAPGPLAGPAFDELLRRQAGALRFSSHALERLQRRGIALSSAQLARLEAGVKRLSAKGGRESVVLLDDAAFVVSVRNLVVITAVLPDRMRDQVFTNIDSAAIG